ncbi:hypothetical protein EDC38_0760 [Marinimicrobium koreense]|uniref:DUF4194 domain-containing protein n=1 Tax=Marinimicrobium koreense TaxID=306545 RepID=A0A3N1NMU8_9GAMM|nr:hypothetical protein [Marinimicrobium koreense]ROQ20162.1 hypothetical protein EDC38_0760 [Marinimicrobium koreense]
MSDTMLFARVTEQLLGTALVCRHTNEVEYKYLANEDNFRLVSDFLVRMNRRLRWTNDRAGVVLTHADAQSTRAKQDCRAMFEETGGQIRPLVAWLTLAQRADPRGEPIKAGATLRKSELLQAIEESAEMQRRLDELCRLRMFLNDNKTPDGQISRILSRLVEMGYLVELSHSKLIYRATARFSLFYDLLTFIQENEGIEIPEGTAPVEGEFDHGG